MRYMQLTKRLIPFATFTLIVLAALTPQNLYSQYSDSTIKEINERLIELHECRQKQKLYIQLAKSDSSTIHRQEELINTLIFANNEQQVKVKRYRNYSFMTSAILILALIL
jgi:hypothetical protein